MLELAAVLLCVAVLLYTLSPRQQTTETEAGSRLPHSDQRREALQEIARDLEFEYRLGKLSSQEYERATEELLAELAAIKAGPEEVGQQTSPDSQAQAAVASDTTCPHCGARFPQPMKFCGECGKPMSKHPSKGQA